MARRSSRTPRRTQSSARISGRRLRNGLLPTGIPGLEYERFFSNEGLDPFDEVEWDLRSAVIGSEKGEVVFEQRDVEIPRSWSQQATNIVVSKYFRGQMGSPERERSVKQLIGRVVDTITAWAAKQKYFATDEDLSAFSDDLKHLLVYQKAAFNSPVWFNVGFEKAPQCSACFINSVQDTMESILGLAKTEGMLFKFGSGTGSNLSNIRSSQELLAGGGTASGPVSFMKGFDAFAGVIKSGGKTRRAAKMVILNAEHPDIEEFINCKVEEEKKAWALIDAGYDGSFTGVAYGSVFFQNSNNSVRVTDEFMRAVLDDGEWTTKAVKDGAPMKTYKARDLMRQIAEGTWICGDPGMQFDTTINDWHTCPNTARINASNPCSEYMFLDDTACNLSSINLMKFVRDEDGEFDVIGFEKACRTMILAQEILVDNASYPTPAIEKNSHAYRPLGLGYANLGALLMSRGLPYDSDGGRDYAGTITAIMHGAAFAESSRVARDHGGPFTGYEKNKEPMMRVMRKHRAAIKDIDKTNVPKDMLEAAKAVWDEVIEMGEQHGFRNAQATVLAPTGTIGFMMDCDTTGVEPDIALVKYKKLVGGGMMKIVNQTVPMALKKLGYSAAADQGNHRVHRRERDHRGGAARQGAAPGGVRLRLQADARHAVDPLHGARPDDGRHAAVPVGRDLARPSTCRSTRRSRTSSRPTSIHGASAPRPCRSTATAPSGRSRSTRRRRRSWPPACCTPEAVAAAGPRRRKLPDERQAITHKFDIAGHEGYITVGLYEDGMPGEIFLVMAKEGLDHLRLRRRLRAGDQLRAPVRRAAAGAGRQVQPRPLRAVGDDAQPRRPLRQVDRRLHLPLDGGEVPVARGAVPRRREQPGRGHHHAGAARPGCGERRPAPPRPREVVIFATIQNQEDAPPCSTCGSIMVRSGACYKCSNCGTTSGCA